MIQINSEFFILENNKNKILNNITKYCSKCYKEFSQNDEIFLNKNNYEYICKDCACCLTQEIDNFEDECDINECKSEVTLF